jgi:hypothetical protein
LFFDEPLAFLDLELGSGIAVALPA